MLSVFRDRSVTTAGIKYLRRQSELPIAIAVTGGCQMLEKYSRALQKLIINLAAFRGALIVGSGRVIDASGRICPTVMEIGPEVLRLSAEATVLGLRPAVYDTAQANCQTIQHPYPAKTLQFDGFGWQNEALERVAILDGLRRDGWLTTLIAFGGGALTYDEAILASQHGHPVMPIANSGRSADTLADIFPAGGIAHTMRRINALGMDSGIGPTFYSGSEVTNAQSV